MIYHEHIYYYSLLAIENHFNRYDMLVFDLKEVENHGGSIRFHVCRKNSNLANPSSQVRQLKESEIKKGFHNASIFQEFGQKINKQKSDLQSAPRGQVATARERVFAQPDRGRRRCAAAAAV